LRKGVVAADDRQRIASTSEAKRKLIELTAQMTIKDALRLVGRSGSTYELWRKNDAEFKDAIDKAQRIKRAGKSRVVPDFPQFCAEFLDQPLFWHQLQWFDILEGREPRDLHPAQTFEAGDEGLILVNVPPEHAKSTTITSNYATWRIVKNPNIRILIVSKSMTFAQKFLYGIKQRLTGPKYRALQVAFGPEGGWQDTAEQWTATQIYLGDKDDGEKDPTVQALGIGGQIYGARADLIIVDDAVVLSNARQYEEHALWITQEVMSRIVGGGSLLVVGTRVAPHDLYKELRQQFEGEWTYFASPAILEDTGEAGTSRTLWPRSNVPCGCKQICARTGGLQPDEDGLYPKWDGPHLFRKRRQSYAGSWSLTFQQADVAEDQTFPEAAVNAALNKQRMPGLMTDGYPGHRAGGMEGLHVICSMDPALSGSCAAVAMGVDVRSGTRWVLDLHNEAGMTPASIHALIKRWTEKYRPREWRIEKNAMQGMLTQDETLRRDLNSMGCFITEHFTGSNKWDPDYGVAGMAPLFLPALEGRETLIDLPANGTNGGNSSAAVQALVAQLVSWRPRPAGERVRRDKPGTTDLVMALWFADVRARELILNRRNEQTHIKSIYNSRGERARQRVINIDEVLVQNAQIARMA